MVNRVVYERVSVKKISAIMTTLHRFIYLFKVSVVSVNRLSFHVNVSRVICLEITHKLDFIIYFCIREANGWKLKSSKFECLM